jgi:hypothetical protein
VGARLQAVSLRVAPSKPCVSVGGSRACGRVKLALCVLLAGDALGGVAKLLVQSARQISHYSTSRSAGGGPRLAVYTDGHVAGDVWLIEASQMAFHQRPTSRCWCSG